MDAVAEASVCKKKGANEEEIAGLLAACYSSMED